MLAMYMNSVSIGYGSPLWALVITRCIRPWAASGASQENALSIRGGRAVRLDQQVLGARREAERRPRQRLAGDDLAGLAGRLRTRAGSASGRAACSESRPAHRSCRAGSAADAARGRCGSRWNAPRCRASRACRPGGPTIVLVAPAAGVGPGLRRCTGGSSKAAWASSAAMRRIVAAGMPVSAGDRVGRVGRVEIALGQQLEHRARAAAVGAASTSPLSAGRTVRIAGRARRARRPVPDQRPAVASRANRPSSAAPGSSITSQAALV